MIDSATFGFQGNKRFEVQAYLGAGTSGEVYRVYDRRLQAAVALKTLQRADPAGLYLFKREFRALAGVHHPNLVQLYELLSEGDQWFFTMELAEGRNFVEYVRQPRAWDSDHPDDCQLQIDALRQIMRQLTDGLSFLHCAGKLHCDIKPSNIRVTDQGRLVLLDFGLVQELFGEPSSQKFEAMIVGTPAYMAPEQASGHPPTQAADWYSVGVVLFEALTGVLPFNGTAFEMLREKKEYEAPAPTLFVPDLPADLAELCRDLLRQNPEDRPSRDEILAALGIELSEQARLLATAPKTDKPVFVGRETHLGELDEAFACSRRGGTVVAYVHGSSGMGKSALVQAFLHRAEVQDPSIVILAGRCYERETVPYKAIDALVDALSLYLRSLPRKQAEILLPTNVLELARLFPTLYRIEAVARTQRKIVDIPDEGEKRRRARTALRELLSRLAERKPLILFIDDLQWGDSDSAELLADLLRPPDPPPLMLVACYRTEEEESSPLLRALLKLQLSTDSTDVHEINLGPLSFQESCEMGLGLLDKARQDAWELAQSIATEAGGSPFFITELVHYWQAQDADTMVGELPPSPYGSDRSSLDQLIMARLERLPTTARRLFEVVAVAGHPIDLEVAVQAAELAGQAQASVSDLRAASLIRLRDAEVQEIEPYHDRIRQSVVQELANEERRQLHGRLAAALEKSGRADPETLALHFREAGELDHAAALATSAARAAAEDMALGRATRLFRFALRLQVHDRATERRLQVELGDVLAQAGKSSEAADIYLAACSGASSEEALELTRRAAAELLVGGHIDRGLETIQEVLGALDIDLPQNLRQTRFSLLRHRLRLQWRGLKLEQRSEAEIPTQDRLRIDTCWALARGLCNVDASRGMEISLRHLLLALDAGEPYRAVRALAIETAYSALSPSRHRQRTERLRQMALHLAQEIDHPHGLGLSYAMAGVAAFREGHWRQASDYLDRGEIILREQCTGVAWELNTVLVYKLRTLLMTGEVARLIRSLPGLMKEIEERTDLYAETILQTRVVWLAYLFADQPRDARKTIDRALGRWSENGFHFQHYWSWIARVEIALYRGKPTGAWQALTRDWSRLEEAGLLKIPLSHLEAWHLRARTALATAVSIGIESRKGRVLLQIAQDGMRHIERHKVAWGTPLAQLLRAGVAAAKGDRRTAGDLLVLATAAFEAMGMELHAAVSRRQRGRLLASAQGEELVAGTEQWMEQQKIKNPEHLSRVLAPGPWTAPAPTSDAS